MQQTTLLGPTLNNARQAKQAMPTFLQATFGRCAFAAWHHGLFVEMLQQKAKKKLKQLRMP